MLEIHKGDCLEELKKLPENSVDAIITDPPYGLEFMGKEWDKFKTGERKSFVGGGGDVTDKTNDAYMRINKTANRPSALTFAQKHQMQKFFYNFGLEAIRVLKSGGFLLIMGGTRTYHRRVCGIEDAGFEIRDTIMWLYGSGFPKSLNIGKQIDKLNGKRQEEFIALGKYIKSQREKLKIPTKEISKLFPSKTGGLTGCLWNWENGLNVPTKEQWIILKERLQLDNKFDYIIEREEAEREVIGNKIFGDGKEYPQTGKRKCFKSLHSENYSKLTEPATPEAKQWDGWGTALKPACEPIVVARKPLSEKNVALNVLKHGTGGINIEDCRIETVENLSGGAYCGGQRSEGDWKEKSGFKNDKLTGKFKQPQGRFPANVILDEEAGKILDEQSGTLKSGKDCKRKKPHQTNAMAGLLNTMDREEISYGDKGGASRFFYCAKASKSEKNFGCDESNKHPTVKPIKLMEYLIKLVTKEGATVLDPFMGSGTTLIACAKLGRKGIGIEKELEYIEIAKVRIKPHLKQTKLSEVR